MSRYVIEDNERREVVVGWDHPVAEAARVHREGGGMKIEKLSEFEKDVLLRKLLHVMPPETRGEIMAEMPVIYTKLAPHTSRTVLEKVAVRLDREAAKAT